MSLSGFPPCQETLPGEGEPGSQNLRGAAKWVGMKRGVANVARPPCFFVWEHLLVPQLFGFSLGLEPKQREQNPRRRLRADELFTPFCHFKKDDKGGGGLFPLS